MLKFFSQKEYQAIADRFGLGLIRSFEHFKQGFQSPKVVVTTPQGKFVISRQIISGKKDIISKSRKSFEYEIALLNHLQSLPVPKYRRAKDGSFVLSIPDSAVTAYEYLPGRTPNRFTPAMAFQLGQFLAEFHSQGQKFARALPGRRRFYDLNTRVMAKMAPVARKQTNPELKAAVEEVRRGVEWTRPPAGLPSGPIHVDIKPENELFSNGRLSGVVDFGNFYCDALMIDVGKTIMWNCMKGKRLHAPWVLAFLKGYESKRRFTPLERAYLPHAILFAIYSHLWVDLYHVPLGYVPESYTLGLVRTFLPAARKMSRKAD